jgi:hypothetical protein
MSRLIRPLRHVVNRCLSEIVAIPSQFFRHPSGSRDLVEGLANSNYSRRFNAATLPLDLIGVHCPDFGINCGFKRPDFGIHVMQLTSVYYKLL